MDQVLLVLQLHIPDAPLVTNKVLFLPQRRTTITILFISTVFLFLPCSILSKIVFKIKFTLIMIYLYKGSRLPGFICICPPKRTNRKSLNSLLTFSISECYLSFSAGVWLQCRPFYVFQSNWISSKTSRDGLKIPPQLSSSWQICWFASEPGPAGCVVESNWELQGSFTVIQDN